jgi:hypothetical protein
MVIATLKRHTTVTDPAEFEKRKGALVQKMTPYLEKQPGFAGHEISLDGDGGAMTEITRWQSEDDARRYIRGGAAAMTATWLDAFLPTAPFPNGNWVRSVAQG